MENTILFIRRSKNIKQADMARDLDVSPSYLCKVEKGTQEPSDKFKKLCAKYLEVALSELFPQRKNRETVKVSETGARNALWSARQARGIKQNELSRLLGCSPSYLSKVEKGLQKPNAAFKKKCAKILKVKETTLFF